MPTRILWHGSLPAKLATRHYPHAILIASYFNSNLQLIFSHVRFGTIRSIGRTPLSNSNYYPSFVTKPFELRAYEKCAVSVKDSMVPLVTLTRIKSEDSLQDALDLISNLTAGRRFIVDFSTTLRPITSEQEAAELRRLKALKKNLAVPRKRSDKQLAGDEKRRERTQDFNSQIQRFSGSEKGNTEWVEFAGWQAGAVPTVILSSAGSVKSQVDFANANGMGLAFRMAPDNDHELKLTVQGLARMQNLRNTLLIVDAGYVRNGVAKAVQATNYALHAVHLALGEQFESLETVSLSGSFPLSSLRDLPRQIMIEERNVFSQVSKSWNVGYGDFASIPQRIPRKGGNQGWFPHVDLVMDAHWQVELEDKKSDGTAYIRRAKALVTSDLWKHRVDCWGTSVISTAAAGEAVIEGVKYHYPGPWIAVRANQHLSRQASRI